MTESARAGAERIMAGPQHRKYYDDITGWVTREIARYGIATLEYVAFTAFTDGISMTDALDKRLAELRKETGDG